MIEKWINSEVARLEGKIDHVKSEIHYGGPHITVWFKNGYGASIIHNYASYGVELAVLAKDADGPHLTYDTPVTDDVEGHLDQASLAALLEQISELPTRG